MEGANEKISPFQGKLTVSSGLLASGALLAILGAFLPWVKVFGLFAVSGTDGDGLISLICGIVIIALLVIVYSKERKGAKVVAIIGYILGLFTVFIASHDGANIGRLAEASQIGLASVGAGVFITAFGGGLEALGGIAELANINAENFSRIGSLAKNDLVKLIVLLVVILIAIVSGIVLANINENEVASNDRASESSSFDMNVSEKTTETKKKEEPELEVISKSFEKGEYGSDYVRGEIKNVGKVDADSPQVTVTLVQGGQVVANTTATYIPGKVPVSAVAPYEASISNAPAFEDIRVEVEAESNDYGFMQYEYLDVLSQNARSGNYGEFSVAGEVKNTSNVNLEDVEVYVWFLDANNQVLEVETTHITGSVPAGSQKPYEASMYFSGDAPNYQAIKVIALGYST